MEPLSPSAASAVSPPPLPRRPAESLDDDGGCSCAAVDPVTVESAWEKMFAMKATESSTGNGNDNTSSARIHVSSPEPLDLRIFCGTWNVAGLKLDNVDDMGEWLDVDLLDAEGEKGHPPDLFVVGFQEVVELSAQNVVMDSFLDTQSRANSLKWFTLVYAYLAKYGQRHGIKYAMLTEQRLLGTYVLVMATEALCPRISQVQTATVPTGLAGILGNKGAVAVRMEVAGTSSLCFVCVHMAAHRENVLARNAEYKLIASRPIFADTTGRLSAGSPGDTAARDKPQGSTWGGLFGAAVGQGGGAGGLSPSRNVEVKKAIRAAMAFGLPRGGGGGKAAAAAAGRTASPKGERNNGSRNGAGIGSTNADPEKEAFVNGANAVNDAQETDAAAWTPSEEGIANGLPKTKTVMQADIVFWLGDLNYRIAEKVSDPEVFEMLRKDDLETLSFRGNDGASCPYRRSPFLLYQRKLSLYTDANLDQLNLARATGDAFQEFQEGPLCFPPSYKYIPGTREFDTRPEKKARCPSWCDRVLYAVGSHGGDSIRRLALDRYWSAGPLLSDHMPVSALFRTSLTCAPEKTIVEPGIEAEPLSPRRAAAAAVFETDPFPRITLEPPALVLALDGSTSVSATALITNVGGLEGKYHVCKDCLPAWMSLAGDGRGELGPGEGEELGLIVDGAVAGDAAASDGPAHRRQPQDPPAVGALLKVEVDGGGEGALLPVLCVVASER